MECYCGAVLSNGSDNDIQLRVYTQTEFEKKVLDKQFPHLTNLPEYDVWRCPYCERLYFFKDGKLEKLYVLENK